MFLSSSGRCDGYLVGIDLQLLLGYFSHVWLFVTPKTVAHQAPLSTGFSRQEYWSELPCLSPGNLPHPEIEPTSLTSAALAGRFLPLASPVKSLVLTIWWCPCVELNLRCWKRAFAMTSAFCGQNSVSLCPASFCIPRPNLPVIPGVYWLSTFAFQSPIMKRTSLLGVSSRRSCRSSRTIQLEFLWH